MHLRRLTALRSALAITVVVGALPAQQAPRVHFTFTANNASHPLHRISSDNIVLDGVLALHAVRTQRFGIIAAAVGGKTFAALAGGDDLVCPIDGDGGCKAGLPGFQYGGLQLGGEARLKRLRFSLTSGPTAFHSDAYRKVGGVDANGIRLFPTLPATTVLSLHTRAEVTLLLGRHIGWVVASTWRHLPQYRGAQFDINGIGTGIRLQ